MHSYHTEPVQTCVCVTLTDSELQIALVALFSEMLYRFPNVVVAQLTRESVQQAIANGITAQQVLLRCHLSHPPTPCTDGAAAKTQTVNIRQIGTNTESNHDRTLDLHSRMHCHHRAVTFVTWPDVTVESEHSVNV